MDSPRSVISKDFFGHAAKDFFGVINSFDKKVEKLGIINGVNISKGENIKLILYKLKK